MFCINAFITQKPVWNIPRCFNGVTRPFMMVVACHMNGVSRDRSWRRMARILWPQTQLRAEDLRSFSGTTFPSSPESWCHPVCSNDRWKRCVLRWQIVVFSICVFLEPGTQHPGLLTNVFLVTFTTLNTVYHATLFFFLGFVLGVNQQWS